MLAVNLSCQNLMDAGRAADPALAWCDTVHTQQRDFGARRRRVRGAHRVFQMWRQAHGLALRDVEAEWQDKVEASTETSAAPGGGTRCSLAARWAQLHVGVLQHGRPASLSYARMADIPATLLRPPSRRASPASGWALVSALQLADRASNLFERDACKPTPFAGIPRQCRPSVACPQDETHESEKLAAGVQDLPSAPMDPGMWASMCLRRLGMRCSEALVVRNGADVFSAAAAAEQPPLSCLATATLPCSSPADHQALRGGEWACVIWSCSREMHIERARASHSLICQAHEPRPSVKSQTEHEGDDAAR